jgi:hypothetical protein
MGSVRVFLTLTAPAGSRRRQGGAIQPRRARRAAAPVASRARAGASRARAGGQPRPRAGGQTLPRLRRGSPRLRRGTGGHAQARGAVGWSHLRAVASHGRALAGKPSPAAPALLRTRAGRSCLPGAGRAHAERRS